MSENVKITQIETHAVSIPYRYPWRNKHTEALACAQIGWSMGTSHESGIKTAAALHAGVAVKNHLYPADILGPLLHEADVLAEPSHLRAGYGTPSDKPGLGISLNEDVLEKYAVTS